MVIAYIFSVNKNYRVINSNEKCVTPFLYMCYLFCNPLQLYLNISSDIHKRDYLMIIINSTYGGKVHI